MSANLHMLANPASGRGRVEAHLRNLQYAARAVGAPFAISTSPQDLRARVARARDAGAERIAVAGGDGSVHQAIQELVDSDTALAPLPLGRGNDFAAAIGIPADFDEALAVALEGRVRRVDLGRVSSSPTDLYFAVNCGAGIDSLAARLANRQRVLGGRIGYPLAAVAALARFRRTEFEVDFDGGRWHRPGMALIVANAFRFGGGMKIAPEAHIDDGLLDLVFIERTFKPRLLPLLTRVYSGGHVDHPAITMARTTRLEMSISRALPLAGDGEPMGEVEEKAVTIEVAPKALSVVAPG